MTKNNYPLEGKRVIVVWTDEMHNSGNDWLAFRVIAAFEEGLVLEGLKGPDGSKHDGSRVLMMWDQVNNVVEWKE